MRVLVTGASGNMGTSVLPRLRAHPSVSEVIGLSRRPPRDTHGAHRWVSADVERTDLAPALASVDAVIHLAWRIQPSRRPGSLWATNVRGTQRLLDAASAAGVRVFVHASSVGAYAPRPSPRLAVDESWPTTGVGSSSYSVAKAYVERTLDAFESAHPTVRVVRLRPAITAKPAAATRLRRLFLGVLVPAPLLRPGRLPVFPANDELGFQLVHSDDVAEAFVRAVTTDGARGAYNVASEPWLSFRDIASVLGARPAPMATSVVRTLASATWRLRLQPLDPGWIDLARFAPALDTTRARTELGWEPTMGSDEVLLRTLAALSEGRGDATPPLAPASPGNRVRELLAGQGAREQRP